MGGLGQAYGKKRW